MITPRWYQEEALQAVYNYFASGKTGNPIIAHPTGTGKSTLPAIFIERTLKTWPNQRFLMITHVGELIKQNADKLLTHWPTAPLGIHSNGISEIGGYRLLNNRETELPIIYGGIQSMIKYAADFGRRDICFIDEAHLVSEEETSMYRRFLKIMLTINPKMKIIGLSATPFRMGLGYITDGSIFTDIVHDMTGIEMFNRLIREGHLSKLIPFPTKTHLEFSNVGLVKGEFNASQLQNAIDKEEITYAALQEAMQMGQNRGTWLIFATGIEHAEHIAEMMGMFGIDCAPIHSKRPADYNEAAMKALRNGSLRSVVNFGKLTTGFDCPRIDFIVCLRPVMSIPLHIQIMGRGTRPSEETFKENCLMGDFGRNVSRLGAINDPIIPRKKGEGGGEAPIKICETHKLIQPEGREVKGCGALNYASAKYCCNCVEEFSFKVKFTAQSDTVEIVKPDYPIIESFDVNYVTYVKKQKPGGKPYIRVSYNTGLRTFGENIFPEGIKIAHKNYVHWWRQRHITEPPSNTEDALMFIQDIHQNFRKPRRITVHVNKDIPEVLNAEW